MEEYAGVRGLRHTMKLQEWTERIRTCRASGKTVKEWCEEQGFAVPTYYYWERRYVTERSGRFSGPGSGSMQAGLLVEVKPEDLSETRSMETKITIRHGESVITLAAGSRMEAVAELVKALNRHV